MAKQAKIKLANGGEVLIDLFEKDAPNTVANFEKLANSGFYNGLIFSSCYSGLCSTRRMPYRFRSRWPRLHNQLRN